MQDLETYLEFVLRPCQRVLVDHWPRPAPARMAPFFTGADNLRGDLEQLVGGLGPYNGPSLLLPNGKVRGFVCEVEEYR